MEICSENFALATHRATQTWNFSKVCNVFLGISEFPICLSASWKSGHALWWKLKKNQCCILHITVHICVQVTSVLNTPDHFPEDTASLSPTFFISLSLFLFVCICVWTSIAWYECRGSGEWKCNLEEAVEARRTWWEVTDIICCCCCSKQP